jgi:hypothetical protein
MSLNLRQQKKLAKRKALSGSQPAKPPVIEGNRASYIVIDDPIKPVDDRAVRRSFHEMNLVRKYGGGVSFPEKQPPHLRPRTGPASPPPERPSSKLRSLESTVTRAARIRQALRHRALYWSFENSNTTEDTKAARITHARSEHGVLKLRINGRYISTNLEDTCRI